MIKSSLALKLATLVLGFSTLILGAVLANSYFFSRTVIVEQAEKYSRTRGREVANKLASLLKPVEQAAQNIALAMENPALTSNEIRSLGRRVVEGNGDMFGMAIAFAPYEFNYDKLYFAPYSYRNNDGIKTTHLGSSDYRYFYMSWYQLPKELGRPVWTEPYFDSGGSDALMTTYSVPFYRYEKGEKYFAGVVTADVTLDWLEEMISAIKLYDTGYAVVVSQQGAYIYHPLQRLVANETVFSLAEGLEDQELWDIGRDMIEGYTGFLKRRNVRDGTYSFLLYMPLPVGGWSLAFLFPTEEVLKEANQLTRNTLSIGIVGFFLLMVAVILIANRLTRPVRDLSIAAMEIASGNLSVVLPETRSRDEVGKLSESFRDMQQSLKEFIVNLERTTIHKERIESELRIAREIQMGLLPKLFPAFPNHDEFDIFASLESAKEVGGDLYDFFFIDDHHFCFLIGDVSGKGVPAAFLMAVTKTLIKVVAEQGVEPNVVLEKVNNDLAEDNESCMFVTLFLAVLDIRNGKVTYSSAGHNPPALMAGNKVSFLESLNEPIAGAMPDMTYTTQHMTLSPGDTLFLYTDGITEAMNNDLELYSEERLLRVLQGTDKGKAMDIVVGVNASVSEFAAGAEQSDDITMLALTYVGSK